MERVERRALLRERSQWAAVRPPHRPPFGVAEAATPPPPSNTNLPLLFTGIVGLLVSATVVSHVVTSRSHEQKAKVAYHKALHRRAGNYVRP